MSETLTEVLNHRQITDRIRRIAWQIYETHQGEKEIVFAGIANRGYQLAELLAGKVREISSMDIHMVKIKVNKKDPLANKAELEQDLQLEGKSILVVDDVLNSGATLICGVRYFLDYRVKGIKTVVLVDRSHKRFPIKGDYKGISLSTNMLEHVQVKIDQEPYAVTVA